MAIDLNSGSKGFRSLRSKGGITSIRLMAKDLSIYPHRDRGTRTGPLTTRKSQKSPDPPQNHPSQPQFLHVSEPSPSRLASPPSSDSPQKHPRNPFKINPLNPPRDHPDAPTLPTRKKMTIFENFSCGRGAPGLESSRSLRAQASSVSHFCGTSVFQSTSQTTKSKQKHNPQQTTNRLPL